MKLVETWTSINNRLKELPYKVYESAMPDEIEVEFVDGYVVPYYVIRHGSPTEAHTGKGIIGTRDNTHRSSFLVTIVSFSNDSLNEMTAAAIDKLQGFRPVDGSELRLFGGMSFSSTESIVRPTTYRRTITFTYLNNLTVGNY